MTIKEVIDSARPVQVMFYDSDHMCSGIMWGDQIVCACCGATFWVDEVIENAKNDGVEAIRMFETWADISDEIMGDDMCVYNTTLLEY